MVYNFVPVKFWREVNLLVFNEVMMKPGNPGIGNSVVFHKFKPLSYKNERFKIELSKIIQTIADRRSIPALINLLDDNEVDIRWIAAEGLIKIGRHSIIPLLRSIRDGHISNSGAYHILQNLLSADEKLAMRHLLNSLGNFPEMAEIAPVHASIALKRTFHCYI